METINERLDILIKKNHKNPKTFAESLGYAPSVIYNILKSRNKPGFEMLEKITEAYPNVNRDWLMAGEGEMFKQEKKRDAVDSGYLIEYITKLEENFNRLSEQLTVKDQQINKMLDLLGKPSDVVEAPTRPLRSVYLAQA